MSTTRKTVFIYTVTVSYVCVLVTCGISLVQEFRLLTNPGQETRSMGFIDLVTPTQSEEQTDNCFSKKDKNSVQISSRTRYKIQDGCRGKPESIPHTVTFFFLFVFHPANIFFSTADCSDRFLATVGALVLRDIISSSQWHTTMNPASCLADIAIGDGRREKEE